MTHEKKSYKALRTTGLVLIGVVLIIGILTGLDYMNYRNGNRSILFGSLDNYNIHQTLKFGNLDLKVNSVVLNTYPKPILAQPDCSKANELSPSGRIDWGKSICEYRLTVGYPDEVSHYKSKNELLVEFQYLNISDNPINLSDYKVKLIANEPLDDYDSPSKPCTGMSKSVFLKGYTEKECLAKDISKGYKGPLVLSVTKSGKEKIINLSIPTTLRK